MYKRILKEYVLKKENVGIIAGIILVLCVSSALAFVMPVVTNSVISIISSGSDENSLLFVCCVAFIVCAVSFFISCFQNYIILYLQKKQSVLMKSKMLESCLKKEWDFYDRYSSGELIYRLYSDATIIADNAVMLPVNLIISVLVLLVANVVIGILMPSIVLLLDAILLTSSVLTVFLMKKTKHFSQELQTKGERLYALTEEKLKRARLTRLYSAHDREIQEGCSSISEYTDSFFDKNFFTGNANTLIGTISSLWTVGVLLIGGSAVMESKITLGELVAFLSIAGLLMPLGNRIGQTILYVPIFRVSLRRFFEILDHTETDFTRGNTEAEITEGKIEVKKLSFSYKDSQTQVFTDVSFEIPPHRMILIRGESGSGKSTLLKLLMRLYRPDSGDIYIDGIKILDYTEEKLRSRIGYVGAFCECFDGSIYDNITYGNLNTTEEDIRRVLRLICLEDVVSALPDGIYTVIGRNGIDLSSGEKQRIALARCILNRPILIFLDEATANLDLETEKAVYENLRTLLTESTIVTVSHRRETEEYADDVICIKEEQV